MINIPAHTLEEIERGKQEKEEFLREQVRQFIPEWIKETIDKKGDKEDYSI